MEENNIIADSSNLVLRLADQEMLTAIKFASARGRSLEKVSQNIYNLVMLDEASASECVFALPRGGKPIRGPSIRFAETIASQYGNCRVGARVVAVDRFEKYVESEGVFHDLETNTITTERVRKRIVDARGRLYSDDMVVMAGNAACSIAKRNAILKAIPRPIWRKAFEAAEGILAGDSKTLRSRRKEALRLFEEIGVKKEQIFLTLEVEGEHDIGLNELATLVAMYQSIKNGEEKIESYFPISNTQRFAITKEKGSVLEEIASEGKNKNGGNDEKPSTT